MGYTTILLDADGTLLDFEAAQREAFFAAMRRMKVPAGEQTGPRKLTHLYSSKANAEKAVEREWGRMQDRFAA